MSKAAELLHAGFLVAARPAAHAFRAALAEPARAQERRLRAVLARCRGSAYGRAVGLERVRSVRDFQARVPIADYADLAPYIARAAQGERLALTHEPPRIFERTSGSTAEGKLVPYTRAYLAELGAATVPWMHDVLTARPALRGTRLYFALSPPTRAPELTPGGTRVGFADDGEYLGRFERAALRRLTAVPLELARETDPLAWRRGTLLHLLAADDLGAFSVWSPSFLTVLFAKLEPLLEELLRELPAWRSAQLRAGLDRHGLTADALWPRLALVSCWTDGPSARLLPELRRFFPNTPLQGKGLLATEGVVSVPLAATEAPVLAVRSHFLELVDVEQPQAKPLLAHEARTGATYMPLLTTSSGLLRYRLNDAVVCVGRCGATPLVRFAGKLDGVSDHCGEKIHPEVAARALAAAERAAGAGGFAFALLAPAVRPMRYEAYVEFAADAGALARATEALEAELARGPYYAHARRLGQLAAARVVPVNGAWAIYERTLIAAGTRAGAVKARALDNRTLWAEAFARGTS